MPKLPKRQWEGAHRRESESARVEALVNRLKNRHALGDPLPDLERPTLENAPIWKSPDEPARYVIPFSNGRHLHASETGNHAWGEPRDASHNYQTTTWMKLPEKVRAGIIRFISENYPKR